MNNLTSQPDPSSLIKVKQLIHRITPLVDDVTDALGIFLLISLIAISWIFAYMHFFQQLPLSFALTVSGLILLPCLILIRMWYALVNIKHLPDNIKELAEDASESATESINTLKSGKRGFLNIFGQARKLFEIRSLLSSGSEIFETYFSIGPLVNPVYLIFSVISLFSLFFVLVLGIILAIISLL